MLANAGSNSTADNARRERVRQRVIEYNAVLREVCAAYVHCRSDGGVVFDTAFVRSDVTTRTAPATGGTAVTLTASDDRGVSGIEMRLGAGSWTRYAGTTLVPTGRR